jgi:ATP-dependent DNA helicase RecG
MRLFEAGGMLHIEEVAVPGTKLESLDYSRLEYYLKEILNEENIPDDESKLVDLLIGKGLMRETSPGISVCTVAGIICFGLKPRRSIPQAGLRVMSYKGTEMEYQAQLDMVLDMPLVGRWQKNERNTKVLVDNGLIEQFLQIFEPFITQEPNDFDEHFRREKTWFYPRDAVRELAINALAHRDWSRTIDIEITNYSDRLAVISPGAFQNSMSIKKMIDGQRSHRNQLIADILRDYGYIEGKGMGIRTKVIPSMRSLNKTDPIFEATEDYVKTTLPRKKAEIE